MRIKRNSNNPVRNTDGYIKKYFGDDIRKILVPQIKNIQNCDIPYVEHREAEEVLGKFLVGDPQVDKSIIFTGLTGSGKTTILRHVFGIEYSSNRVKISGKTVIIPIDFNKSQVGAQEAIESSMNSAVSSLCKLYSIDRPSVNNSDFLSFVEEFRDDFLHLDIEQDDNTSVHDRLKIFHDKQPIAFTSCQLQYVLNDERCDIDLVVLIVDNVEGFLESGDTKMKYVKPVIEALRLFDCIGQRQQPTKWCFNMIIACRHYVWRLLIGDEDVNESGITLLESFITSENAYDLKHPVEISQIVESRDRSFSRNQNSERWKTSVAVVKTLLEKMKGSIGDFILQLEMKDLRKSLARMQNLILHSGLQNVCDDNIGEPGAFQIGSASQFDLSRINLIRTLALGNLTRYSDSGVIPNLLLNERQEGFELYVILALKYFLEKSAYEEPAWENSIEIGEFYQIVKELLADGDEHVENLFRKAVRYLIKHRMLLRSADQPQDEVPGMSTKEIAQIEKVYVSGAAVRLWEELGLSSALFQLYMDDIYVEQDSPYLEPNGNDIEHCFEYLKYLWDMELRIFHCASNHSQEHVRAYIACFGKESICYHLAQGLLNSLGYIGEHDPNFMGRKAKAAYDEVEEFISRLESWDSYLN